MLQVQIDLAFVGRKTFESYLKTSMWDSAAEVMFAFNVFLLWNINLDKVLALSNSIRIEFG